MNELKKSVIATSKALGINHQEIIEIFDRYDAIPFTHKSISVLRTHLKLKYPYIFTRKIVGVQHVISINEQEAVKARTLAEHAEIIERLKSITDIQRYLQSIVEHQDSLRKQIQFLFPTDEFHLSFRCKEPESIFQNVKFGNSYTLSDVIGLRIVPKRSETLPKVLQKLESELSQNLAFKLNIFSYSTAEIIKKISAQSIYYRAFHYHLKVGDFLGEIQVRTRATDHWANLNHDTLYKPKITLDDRSKKHIFDFGEVANIVDYYEILNL